MMIGHASMDLFWGARGSESPARFGGETEA